MNPELSQLFSQSNCFCHKFGVLVSEDNEFFLSQHLPNFEEIWVLQNGKIRKNWLYLIADMKNKMWIVPSERISTFCVVVKSPGSQVYLNFLFNGHFFTDAQMQFRELSVKLCQLKSLFRTTTYTEYFFTFLKWESLQILSQREIVWWNSSSGFSNLLKWHKLGN